MYLTDCLNNTRKWQFPAETQVPALGQLLVFASGQNITDASLDENGSLHANFKLAAAGEVLALASAEGAVFTEIEIPLQFAGVSCGAWRNLGPDIFVRQLRG